MRELTVDWKGKNRTVLCAVLVCKKKKRPMLCTVPPTGPTVPPTGPAVPPPEASCIIRGHWSAGWTWVVMAGWHSVSSPRPDTQLAAGECTRLLYIFTQNPCFQMALQGPLVSTRIRLTPCVLGMLWFTSHTQGSMASTHMETHLVQWPGSLR